DAAIPVEGNVVALSGHDAADDVVAGAIEDEDAVIEVGQVRGPGSVGADRVAQKDVARGEGPVEQDALSDVRRDDVLEDLVIRGGDPAPRIGFPPGPGAGGVGAVVVAVDRRGTGPGARVPPVPAVA